jgi:glycosyltransferase involved in cell wall biosynthesis
MTAPRSGVSIVYLTHREAPHFHWFADALARQIGQDDVEVIVVDGLYASSRREAFTAATNGRFAFQYVPAKPTPYSGAHRLTTADCFAAASARNTGIIYATRAYIVFADDVSVPQPRWWARVKAAAAGGYVVAGAYQKHYEVQVSGGLLVHSRPFDAGIDSRWQLGDDTRPVRVAGSQLFGCSFGAPRSVLLDVNGSDEICDPVGGEDSNLGCRLEWSGHEILYDRAMLTIESEELHVGPAPRRVMRSTTPYAYMLRLREFGLTERAVHGAWDNSFMTCDLLFGIRTPQTLGNYYVLDGFTPDDLPRLPQRFPTRYWFDGQPVATL